MINTWIRVTNESLDKNLLIRLILWRWKKDMEQALVIWVFVHRSESNQAPRFLTEVLGTMVVLPILRLSPESLASCCLVPIMRNSVFSLICHEASMLMKSQAQSAPLRESNDGILLVQWREHSYSYTNDMPSLNSPNHIPVRPCARNLLGLAN